MSHVSITAHLLQLETRNIFRINTEQQQHSNSKNDKIRCNRKMCEFK